VVEPVETTPESPGGRARRDHAPGARVVELSRPLRRAGPRFPA